MAENHYARCLVTDNKLCVPLIPPEELRQILASVDAMLVPGARPEVLLDLEHLQAVDYGSFDLVTDEHREFIKRLHAANPIRSDELVYLALRSMIGFSWPPPESEDDARRAAAFEYALREVLVSHSMDLGGALSRPDSRLPYWGRMSFLRVMSAIPEDQIVHHQLNKVACVLVKRHAFNATTFALENGAIIGLNFALEPILKNLNRYLLHFFHTQHLAGPSRMQRAWDLIVPTIRHFWASAPANQLAGVSLIPIDRVQRQAHSLTADQVDFIVMHELGHVVFNHPTRMRAIEAGASHATLIRHEFEFSADPFACGVMRSRMLNDLRYVIARNQHKPGNKEETYSAFDVAMQYEECYHAVCLLFIYMDFIDQAGRLLKSRLGDNVGFRARLDSHPTPRARLERFELAHLGDIRPKTKIMRYATEFFAELLSFTDTLDPQQLMRASAPNT
jgi:hypothetical protein